MLSTADLQTLSGQLRAHSEIAGTYKFLQDIYKMIGLEMPEIRITLPLHDLMMRKNWRSTRQVYGQQVSFGTQQAEFWFDEWVLNVPIPSADLMTFNVYAGKCQVELQRLEETAEQPSLDSAGTGLFGSYNVVYCRPWLKPHKR